MTDQQSDDSQVDAERRPWRHYLDEHADHEASWDSLEDLAAALTRYRVPVPAVAVLETGPPTQVARPWRAVARTVFEVVVSFAAMWALIVEAIGLDPGWQWVAGSLTVTGAITRVMALPAVETFLRRFVPWLAADVDTTPATEE